MLTDEVIYYDHRNALCVIVFLLVMTTLKCNKSMQNTYSVS